MRNKRVDQKTIKPMDINNCVMTLEMFGKPSLQINYSDWLIMGDATGWLYLKDRKDKPMKKEEVNALIEGILNG